DFPTSTGASQTKVAGGQDAFVLKLDSTGATLTYSTYLGGGDTDSAAGIAVDLGGNAYVTGVTKSTDFPTTSGAFQTKLAGGNDAWVTKVNTGGTAFVYSTYLGGGTSPPGVSDTDVGNAIAVDANGLAFVTGQTNSTDFPTTTGAFQSASAGSDEAYLTVL